jgi:putative redox protein
VTPVETSPASKEPAHKEPAHKEPAHKEPASREPASKEPAWGQWPGPAGELAVYEPSATGPPGSSGGVVVVSHGFPVDKGPPELIPASLVALSDRLASDSGWRVVACCLRGVGKSPGNFSLRGWLDDLEAVVAKASENSSVGGAWLVGAGIAGALAICLAADDTRVRGVASLAAPATFADWAADPAAVATYAREVGVYTGKKDPDLVAWSHEFAEILPAASASRLKGRPVLVLHGADDDVVPAEDAKAIALGVGESAELRILAGAGHRLNSDPRAVALLLGWLERQRT